MFSLQSWGRGGRGLGFITAVMPQRHRHPHPLEVRGKLSQRSMRGHKMGSGVPSAGWRTQSSSSSHPGTTAQKGTLVQDCVSAGRSVESITSKSMHTVCCSSSNRALQTGPWSSPSSDIPCPPSTPQGERQDALSILTLTLCCSPKPAHTDSLR